MKFNKTILGTTFALSALFATAGFNTEEAKAAEWTARTVEEVSADIESVDESTSSYTIVYGDTLSTIATAAGVNLDTLVQINEIENADLIFPANKISFTKDESGEVDEIVVEDTTHTKDTYKVEEESVSKTETTPTVEAVSYEAETTPEVEATAVETTTETEATTETTTATASTDYSAASEVPYFVLQVVEAEAGPGYADTAAVFSVIVNRANSGNWGGTTLLDVVNASGQFEVVSNGMAASTSVSDTTYQAVNDVLTNGVTTSAQSFYASGDGVTNVFY
ncbi:LysM peptidoglycan-binding domain-containing protein [Aerococcus agrisoli]|uniref:LysM peptidoglycan-binding domain-containing protein n=1 Tax=Aerococcus agrisoli TaxID=2487350 RepID=A0A3N4GWB8_9LACT|nr:cell wall hydrolase [Aerococcus agrisoli]RPA64996.1 LysM peptidoglycan-binding domain-containing protein [Aerococcus agrisoli]